MATDKEQPKAAAGEVKPAEAAPTMVLEDDDEFEAFTNESSPIFYTLLAGIAC